MAAVLALGLTTACSPTPAPHLPPPRSGDDSELVRLAEEALERGDLDTAARRFERVLATDPGSQRARTGLGQIALARGDLDQARSRLVGVVAQDPGFIDAQVALARLEIDEGNREAAAQSLDAALARDPTLSEAHAMLADLTGPAPRTPLNSVESAVARADAHPYDPAALLAAGILLERDASPALAVAYFEKVLWLADIEPPAAIEAARGLARIDPAWGERGVVPVHVLADESFRARPGWRFQVRTLWLSLSTSLSGILDLRFVPMSIGPCRSAAASDALDAIHAACFSSGGRRARSGLLAAFTARRPPRGPGRWKQGLAEYMGGRLTLRVPDTATQSRVLAHEVLHIYGGVHVVDAVESLMNQSGESMRLDRANARIARALRERSFERRGLEVDVLSRVELEETIAALEEALTVNLSYRKLGLAEAEQTSSLSRYQAAVEVREAIELDDHLADVLRTLAALKLADERMAEAIGLLEVAEHLYGPDSPRGRELRRNAEHLRAELRRRFR
jgi:tetratricopeptide (TPR) repeat protein